MPTSLQLSAPLLAIVLASASAAGGELYKWTDENGVINYSNNPPAKTRGGKPATIVEDRLSVYTPEKTVTDAIERGKDRRTQAGAAPLPARAGETDRRPAPTAAPPAPPVAYDPCLNLSDPNCQGYPYDGSPVFTGRRRAQPLVQPQLPRGAIAGQVTGSTGYIPGLSGSAPPQVAPPPRRPPESAPLRERDR